jgi:hypothetical protein
MSDLDKLIEGVREARREIARWRTVKLQSDRDVDYDTWERAGRELVHWTYVEELRVRLLADAVLARAERRDNRRYRLTIAGRAELAKQADGSNDLIPF